MAITLTSKAAFADKTFQAQLVNFFGSKQCLGFSIGCMESRTDKNFVISTTSRIKRPKNWPERNVIA